MPLFILENYSNITYPKEGVSWRANFYKISEKGSNPHFITWNPVDNPMPDFHLPGYFGIPKFQ